ncbi:hypothetical protein SBADM41S_00967 [Streptomyces badius]
MPVSLVPVGMGELKTHAAENRSTQRPELPWLRFLVFSPAWVLGPKFPFGAAMPSSY